MTTCSGCGQPAQAGIAYCRRCGRSLAEGVAPPRSRRSMGATVGLVALWVAALAAAAVAVVLYWK